MRAARRLRDAAGALVVAASLSLQASGTCRVASVGSDLSAIASAIALYRIDNGALPVDLGQLVAPTANGDTRYLDPLPKDAWRHDYIYEPQDSVFALRSSGPNGRDEHGAGDDIVHPADCPVRCGGDDSTPIVAWVVLAVIGCAGIFGRRLPLHRRVRLRRPGTGRT